MSFRIAFRFVVLALRFHVAQSIICFRLVFLSKTAFFLVYRGITKHGEPLLCCHPSCQERGVRFVYCSVCNIPAAICNFSSRHAHEDLNIEQESYDFTLRHKQKAREQDPGISKKQQELPPLPPSKQEDTKSTTKSAPDSRDKKRRKKREKSKKRKRQDKPFDEESSYPQGSTVAFAVEAHPPRPPPRLHHKHHKLNDGTARERSPHGAAAAAAAAKSPPGTRDEDVEGEYSSSESSSPPSGSSSSCSSFQDDVEIAYQSSDVRKYRESSGSSEEAGAPAVSCSSLSRSSSPSLKNDQSNGSTGDENSNNNSISRTGNSSSNTMNYAGKKHKEGERSTEALGRNEFQEDPRRKRIWLSLLKVRPRDHGSDVMSAWLMTLLAVSDRRIRDIDRLESMVVKFKKSPKENRKQAAKK